MKKILCTLLAILMAISMFSCGGELNFPGDEPVSPSHETVDPPAPTETAPTAETPVVDPPKEEPAGPIESELLRIQSEYPLTDGLGICREYDWVTPEITIHHRFDKDEKPIMSLVINCSYEEISFECLDMEMLIKGTYAKITDEECYFDIYFRMINSADPSTDFMKVTLKPHMTYGHDYFCRFYDSLYPYMEVGEQYDICVVAREGDTILGWRKNTLNWNEKAEQLVKDMVADGGFET